MEILIFFTLFFCITGVLVVLSRPSLEQRKSRLINMYSSLLSDMNVDYKDTAISIENIRNIAKSILNFGGEIRIVSAQVKKESEENKKWLFEIVSEFSQNLTLWIHRHMNELDVTKEHIGEDNTGKNPALDLAEKRLDLQIENLRKVIL